MNVSSFFLWIRNIKGNILLCLLPVAVGHTSVSGASHYIKCVTPIGSHRRPPAYTHTAKKVSQPSAMLRNSQVASSRREIPKITCFIVLFLFCKLSLSSLLSPVATQWWRSNIPLCLKEFPRARPKGTPKGGGVYLIVYPVSSPNTDSTSF